MRKHKNSAIHGGMMAEMEQLQCMASMQHWLTVLCFVQLSRIGGFLSCCVHLHSIVSMPI